MRIEQELARCLARIVSMLEHSVVPSHAAAFDACVEMKALRVEVDDAKTLLSRLYKPLPQIRFSELQELSKRV